MAIIIVVFFAANGVSVGTDVDAEGHAEVDGEADGDESEQHEGGLSEVVHTPSVDEGVQTTQHDWNPTLEPNFGIKLTAQIVRDCWKKLEKEFEM